MSALHTYFFNSEGDLATLENHLEKAKHGSNLILVRNETDILQESSQGDNTEALLPCLTSSLKTKELKRIIKQEREVFLSYLK